MIITKEMLIGIIMDIFFMVLYVALYVLNATLSSGQILALAVLSYVFMVLLLIIINNKTKFNLCVIFIILSFLFYFGQYVELIITGNIENKALSIINSFSIDRVNHTAIIVLFYMHLIHAVMIIFSRNLNYNSPQILKKNISLQVIKFSSVFIYIVSYPLALFYQYTRYNYTKIWGYGNTLYEQFTNQSSLLKLGEFLSGYVISMFILLLLLYKGKKKIIILMSILPYILLYMLSGSRLQIALLIIVIVLIKHSWEKPITLKEWCVGLFLGVIFSYMLAVSSSIRNYMGLYSSPLEAIMYAMKNTSLFDGVVHLFDEFGCQIVSITCVFENCPGRVGFNYGKLFLYGIEIIIPNLFGYKRIFYTDNTDDAFKMYINKGSTGLGSSFISESYYCFGFFGVICVMLLGYFISRLSVKIINCSYESNVLKVFIYYYLTNCIIFTIRGDTFNIASSVFQYAILPIILMYFVQGIVNEKMNIPIWKGGENNETKL